MQARQRGNQTNMYTSKRDSLENSFETPAPSVKKLELGSPMDIRETNIHTKSGTTNPDFTQIGLGKDSSALPFAISPDLVKRHSELKSLTKFKPGMQSMQAESRARGNLQGLPFQHKGSIFSKKYSAVRRSQEKFKETPTITGSPSLRSATRIFGERPQRRENYAA